MFTRKRRNLKEIKDIRKKFKNKEVIRSQSRPIFRLVYNTKIKMKKNNACNIRWSMSCSSYRPSEPVYHIEDIQKITETNFAKSNPMCPK